MTQLTTITKHIMCETAFRETMKLQENRILLENILVKLRDKLKTILQNFKIAWTEQRQDFKGFGDLVFRYLTSKYLSAEETEKLRRNFADVLKMSGVAITFPILGAMGNLLLGWLTNKLTGGRFTTLPSKFASNLLGKDRATRYTTDGIDTPGDPTM